MLIPFNKPYMTGKELWYIAQAHANGHLAGDGPFTRKCNAWLVQRTGARKALLTHSCTAALEMAAMLAGVGPGDEVIMPSFTFVSTANAFVLRGATPVFVDIRPDTLNIDETQIEAGDHAADASAIVPVHYAGVGCEMDAIMDIAASAQAARHRGRRTGNHVDLQGPPARQLSGISATLSFPRDEEHHLGRRRRAAGQRRAVRRARRDHPREGHEPQPVLPRPGRQVHLGGHRLVLPCRAS